MDMIFFSKILISNKKIIEKIHF